MRGTWRESIGMNYILEKSLFIAALIKEEGGSSLGKKQLKDQFFD